MFICIFDPNIFDPVVFQTQCAGTPIPPQTFGVGGNGGGYCGVEFERLEMYEFLKSMMGGGMTLHEAMKLMDFDEIEYLKESGHMKDLPLEIPKAARQGGSPRMMSSRVDLTPVAKLNSLIEEFEVKLQQCSKKRGEFE